MTFESPSGLRRTFPGSPAGIELDDESTSTITAARSARAAVFERAAGAINPFPRKADAALDRVAASPRGGQDGKPESPFAVLAKIKEKG
jgi:hypothetical protein